LKAFIERVFLHQHVLIDMDVWERFLTNNLQGHNLGTFFNQQLAGTQLVDYKGLESGAMNNIVYDKYTTYYSFASGAYRYQDSLQRRPWDAEEWKKLVSETC